MWLSLCRVECVHRQAMCFVRASLKEALRQSIDVNIKQHYRQHTAAPQRCWIVIKWPFVGSCRRNQMGLFWRYRLVKDGVGLYLVIFIVNSCEWPVYAGSHDPTAGWLYGAWLFLSVQLTNSEWHCVLYSLHTCSHILKINSYKTFAHIRTHILTHKSAHRETHTYSMALHNAHTWKEE